MNQIESLLEAEKVQIEQIDDAVRRILKVKFELGLFDDPYLYCDEEEQKVTGSEEIREGVLDMAKINSPFKKR